MRARIYQVPKTATQSGTAFSGQWVLDWQTPKRQVNDQLLGWWGSRDTLNQVRLSFETKEHAIAYAQANAIEYQVEEPPATRPIKPKAYADNFRYGRAENWTH